MKDKGYKIPNTWATIWIAGWSMCKNAYILRIIPGMLGIMPYFLSHSKKAYEEYKRTQASMKLL